MKIELKCKNCRHSYRYMRHLSCGWQKGSFPFTSNCNLQEKWNPYRNPNYDEELSTDKNILECIKPISIIGDKKEVITTVYASYEPLVDNNSTNGLLWQIDWKRIKSDYKQFKETRTRRNI